MRFNSYAWMCIGLFLGIKLLVRWVWYRPEHMRPGFIRHFFTIRALDFGAMIALCGAFFFVLISGNLVRAATVTGILVAYDFVVRVFFLNIEAHRMCRHSGRWDMKSARRRLRRRARQESPF